MLVSRSTAPTPLDDGARREFRIFRAGINRSTQGDDLFDAEAARLVMAAAAAYSNDYAIDLEHASLNPDALAARADAAAALGYFRIEVRNGELWATHVRWTDRGKRVLASKEARYLSPAFKRDPETNRIVELVNVSAVAQPATYSATELVAASKFGARSSTVIAARVSNATRDRVVAIARRWKTTPGEYLRILATAAAAKDPGRALVAIAKVLGLAEDATAGAVKAAIDQLLAVLDEGTPTDPTAASAEPAPSDGAVSALSAYDREKAAEINDPEKRKRFVELRLRRSGVSEKRAAAIANLECRLLELERDRELRRPLSRAERDYCARDRITETEFRRLLAAAVRRHGAPAVMSQRLSREARDYCRRNGISVAEFQRRKAAAVRRVS